MATILFNGVETDASALVEGTGLADRLTARGGAGGLAAGLDGLEADLDDGDDLIELDANGEDADVTLNGADGDGAVQRLANAFDTVESAVTVASTPFRVLFFDNDTDGNGLYVVSGLADYKAGELTAINTNPTGSSAMGGRHTIVKVEGGSGAPIALSDINLV